MIPRATVQTDQRDSPVYQRVTVTAPARLHLGFFDLNGDLGRRFGSLGITLDAPVTRLSVAPAGELSGVGPSSVRALDFAERAVRGLGLYDGVRIVVDEAIPEHAGLGSGTQIAIATGVALARLYGRETTPREIAAILDRGHRSGIGIGSFESGGVLYDGGRDDSDGLPPILGRFDFPEAWRIILIFDRRQLGIRGSAEADAFRSVPPFPAELSAGLCRLVLMSALPALAEGNAHLFGEAVAELQRVIGDYFAPVQGGRFASPAVAEVLGWFEAQGIPGIGQSSWGPTGFALIGGEAEARTLLRAAREKWAKTDYLDFSLCRGRNTGGTVDITND